MSVYNCVYARAHVFSSLRLYFTAFFPHSISLHFLHLLYCMVFLLPVNYFIASSTIEPYLKKYKKRRSQCMSRVETIFAKILFHTSEKFSIILPLYIVYIYTDKSSKYDFRKIIMVMVCEKVSSRLCMREYNRT